MPLTHLMRRTETLDTIVAVMVAIAVTGGFFASCTAIADDLSEAAARVRQTVAHRGGSAECPENTLAGIRRAIESGATAVEVDVRTTKDGHLVLLHDATLDRTTNGTGPVSDMTFDALRALDAGSWFDARFHSERVPTLGEVLALCRGKIDVLLDLKERSDDYQRRVAGEVKAKGDPKRMIVGVRSVEQAKVVRHLLPEARQIGLIGRPEEIEAYVAAGVETVRLWPRWLEDQTLVPRVRKAGAKLHVNDARGSLEEIRPLLKYKPDSLSSDDPARLVKTLAELRAAQQ